jgi:cell division protein FtsB
MQAFELKQGKAELTSFRAQEKDKRGERETLRLQNAELEAQVLFFSSHNEGSISENQRITD